MNVQAALVLSSLVLLAGCKLVNGIHRLQTHCIPEPVAGGLMVAIMLYALYATTGSQIRLDSTLSAPLMLTFFHSPDCSIFAHGFARARCADCGHDILVAYSCKCHGVCPSCPTGISFGHTTHRTAETAAQPADHVIPRLPVRQWELSVPMRLRYGPHPVTRNAIRQFSTPRITFLAPAAAMPLNLLRRLACTETSFHDVVVDGIFEADAGDGVSVHPASGLDLSAIAEVQGAVRLNCCVRSSSTACCRRTTCRRWPNRNIAKHPPVGQRLLLGRCRGAHRGPRARRSGTAAALLLASGLCAGTIARDGVA